VSFTQASTGTSFAWSYSQLKNFETCAKRYYHYNVHKDVKEPETDQLREGNALHKAFELRVKNGTSLPLGMGQHEPLLAKLAAAPGKVYAEQKLALTAEFQPVGFFGRNVWFRTVIDYTNISVAGDRATVLDYKTGKVAHDLTQLQLMAVTLFHNDAKIQRVKAALVFVHNNHVEPAEFVREDVTEIWSEILPRVRVVEQARARQEYPPKPSGLCKKYCAVSSCPYHGRGG
jgi:hypothetical protein